MVNFEALIAPINENLPAGIDLKEQGDHDYFILKDYRLAASKQERDAIYDENAPKDSSSWRKIIELAPTLLTRSKDLNVAGWLTEALIRIEGYDGLNTGLKLLTTLIQNYWPDLYPREDEDGLITKISPIISLNGQQGEGTLIAPIYSQPLATNQDLVIAGWQYQQALNYSKITDTEKLANLEKRGVLTLDAIKAVVMQTPVAFFAQQQEIIQECLTQLNVLKDILDQCCGSHEAPPTSNIQQALKFCLETVQTFSRIRQPNAAKNQPVVIATEKNPTAIKSPDKNYNYDHIESREQALAIMIEIANFFRASEPQSPIPFLLEQAVRWSQLSLPDLLAELVPNPDFLNHCFRMIGYQNGVTSLDDVGNETEEYQESELS